MMDKKELLKANLKALTIFDANNETLTVDECAKFLKRHYQTVYRLVQEKKITAKLVGGSWVIPKIQFLDQIVESFENETYENENIN